MRLVVLFFISVIFTSCAQQVTNPDILRGSITPERAWWDLVHYDLSVEVFPESKSIKGTNVLTYKVLENNDKLQLDLQKPMQLVSVTQDGENLEIHSTGAAHFISLKAKQKKGTIQKLTVVWEGKPRVAKRAPWDGGFVWTTDEKNRPFIATANQGIGSSVWWPNKDHPYDEVDSLDMHITVPKGLTDVSNGRLVGVDSTETTNTFHWTVKNPINNYGVNLNIGHYVSFTEIEKYKGEKHSR